MAKRSKKVILLDTNILIDILQGDKNLEESIYQLGVTRCAISVITKTEIIAGMRKGELQKTKTLLNKFRTYHINLTTSKIFIELINRFGGPTHKIQEPRNFYCRLLNCSNRHRSWIETLHI